MVVPTDVGLASATYGRPLERQGRRVHNGGIRIRDSSTRWDRPAVQPHPPLSAEAGSIRAALRAG